MTSLTAIRQATRKGARADLGRGREPTADRRNRARLVRLAGRLVALIPPALWTRVGGAAGALASRASRSPLAGVALGVALAQLIRIPRYDRAGVAESPTNERESTAADEHPAQPMHASAPPNRGLGSTLIAVLQRSASAFFADDVLTLAGALTFSTLLSFAPLMLLALWATTAIGPARKRHCSRSWPRWPATTRAWPRRLSSTVPASGRPRAAWPASLVSLSRLAARQRSSSNCRHP